MTGSMGGDGARPKEDSGLVLIPTLVRALSPLECAGQARAATVARRGGSLAPQVPYYLLVACPSTDSN